MSNTKEEHQFQPDQAWQTGGPAFPQFGSFLDEGLTMRDYFAAKAMSQLFEGHGGPYDKVGHDAYRVADLMLVARQVTVPVEKS